MRKGQILARVGSDMFEANLAEAQARLEGAEAIHEKSEELFKREHVPRQELIAATSALRAAEARVRQAELRLERSVIEAPISGVAAQPRARARRGASPPGPRSPSCTAWTASRRSPESPRTTSPPSRWAARPPSRSTPSPAAPSRAGSTSSGRRRWAPAAPSRRRSLSTTRSGELRPGMIARVALVKRTLEDAIVVERDVLQDRDAGPVAVVAAGGVASVRQLDPRARRGQPGRGRSGPRAG